MTTTTWAGTAGHITALIYRRLVWVLTQIDWTEVGQIIWHGLLALLVCTYLAGEFTGRWVHRTNDRLARLWVRLWVPTPSSDRQVPVKFEVHAAPAPVALLVMAQAAVQTAPASVAPPQLVHISDPMLRAVRMVRTDGKSQRLAASLCGVSRSSLQRALKA